MLVLNAEKISTLTVSVKRLGIHFTQNNKFTSNKRKFKIFTEPQKIYLRICVIYIFILRGEKRTTLFRAMRQKLRQFLFNTDAIFIVPSSR
jgi:hypothetical protein